MSDLGDLPGGVTVEQGLADLAAGRTGTVEALLVAVATVRLRELGIEPPAVELTDPELALYAALGVRAEDPYYRYNALLRELDSFLAALADRRRAAPAA